MIELPAQACPAVPRLTPLSSKIFNAHLERLAIVYVRQSSTKQVEENIEFDADAVPTRSIGLRH